MKAIEVIIGAVYSAKVSSRITDVRLDHKLSIGRGWRATNLATGREIIIRSPQRLRSLVKAAPVKG